MSGNDIPPDELDAKMDMLDIAGLDSIEVRLPLIEGIEYTRPRSFAEFFRDNGEADAVSR